LDFVGKSEFEVADFENNLSSCIVKYAMNVDEIKGISTRTNSIPKHM
jgi:hypothetical protein